MDIALQRDVEGDLLLADIGQGVPLRPGSIDAAISISAIQWLCNADSSDVSPLGRLNRFFGGLYAALRRGGRAVCHFYPKNEEQRAMISGAAIKAGFGAGILEDEPGTKNAKLYLVLTVGGGDVPRGDITGVVSGMEGVDVVDKRRGGKRAGRASDERKGSKQWILKKKEQMQRKGKVVKASSKYTGFVHVCCSPAPSLLTFSAVVKGGYPSRCDPLGFPCFSEALERARNLSAALCSSAHYLCGSSGPPVNPAVIIR